MAGRRRTFLAGLAVFTAASLASGLAPAAGALIAARAGQGFGAALEVQGASPLRTGPEFLPLALVIGAGAHLASRLLPRAGSRC